MIEGVIEASSSLFRFIFVDFIIEILCKKLGYYILRLFNKNINPNSLFTVFVGFISWCILISSGIYLLT